MGKSVKSETEDSAKHGNIGPCVTANRSRMARSTEYTVTFAASGVSQADRVDFARDVQPIFKQYCYGCHGATVHQSGFRLDRRSDAMRGGTITVIGPGN